MKRGYVTHFSMVIATALAVAGSAGAAEQISLAQLALQTHFHGIAAHPTEPDRFFLATHHGLFVVGSDGKATPISQQRDDFMGFTPHPTSPSTLYASGHPTGGGNLGFIVSVDGGRSWRKLSDGVDGPVDFHQMDVSPADPQVVYGVHGGVQRSDDGGRRWRRIGPAPAGLIDLAASSRDANTVYAATERGLLKSGDGGRAWAPIHPAQRPATMIEISPGGDVYAFVLGIGLIRARESAMQWETLSRDVSGAYVLHLGIGPGDILYAVAHDPKTSRSLVVASRDGGKAWVTLAGE